MLREIRGLQSGQLLLLRTPTPTHFERGKSREYPICMIWPFMKLPPLTWSTSTHAHFGCKHTRTKQQATWKSQELNGDEMQLVWLPSFGGQILSHGNSQFQIEVIYGIRLNPSQTTHVAGGQGAWEIFLWKLMWHSSRKRESDWVIHAC